MSRPKPVPPSLDDLSEEQRARDLLASAGIDSTPDFERQVLEGYRDGWLAGVEPDTKWVAEHTGLTRNTVAKKACILRQSGRLLRLKRGVFVPSDLARAEAS